MADAWAIHTAVFDLDDTLFAERDYVAGGFRAVGEWARVELQMSDFTERAWALFEAGRRGNIFDEVLAPAGGPAPDGLVRKAVEVYRAHEPRLRLFPDAAVVLNWARGRGLKLALLTDGFMAVQQKKVAALGLERIFSPLIFTDAWGRESWKPATRGFEEIARQCGGPPAGFVYVADNPHKDFIAPRSLGWHSVRIRRPGGEHSGYKPAAGEAAEREIGRLEELIDLLAEPR